MAVGTRGAVARSGLARPRGRRRRRLARAPRSRFSISRQFAVDHEPLASAHRPAKPSGRDPSQRRLRRSRRAAAGEPPDRHRGGRRPPVHVIGHSRGGLFARALLTRHPEHIAQVITLGSPLTAEFDCSVPVAVAVAGARAAQNLIRPGSRKAGCFTSHCQCGYPADLASDLAPGARFTSIYSFDDGMVRPSACRIAGADCIAVPGSHLGLPVNAEVYKHLARLLPIAQTEG